MKSGLGNKEKGKGKGALRDAYGFGTRCTPERPGSSGFKPTLCPGCEIIQRQISCHTTRRRQRSTGKIGQFPRAARGPTRRTWEADINLESLGPESGCDGVPVTPVSPRFQNSQDPESLWSSVVRSAQRGKVIWCLEDKLKDLC
jgi:hypothetical protein